MTVTLADPAASSHFSPGYAARILDLAKIAERMGQGELAGALRIFHAEGVEELAEAEIRAAIFADWCCCRREIDRMIGAMTQSIAKAVAKAQRDLGGYYGR